MKPVTKTTNNDVMIAGDYLIMEEKQKPVCVMKEKQKICLTVIRSVGNDLLKQTVTRIYIYHLQARRND